MSLDSGCDNLLERLRDPATKLVVLTGAGISAESGIPTFRDPGEGLWAQYDPQELASAEGFRKNPKLVFQWYAWRRAKVMAAQANQGHMVLARWAQRFPAMTLVTQNVDGLHTRAGSSQIIEMHGSIHILRCFDRGHEGSWDDLPSQWTLENLEPLRCQICGSWMRPGVVWFGESIASSDMEQIGEALANCEVFLAIGTSGVVYPAAGFLAEARRQGAFTVVINPDSAARGTSHLFLKGKAAEVLPGLDAALEVRISKK